MDFLGVISWAASAIGGQIAALVTWVTSGFGMLFNDVVGVNSFAGGLGDWIGSALSGLWGWLQNIYQWIQSHIIQKLHDLISRIRDWLKKYLGPWLKRIRQIIAWEQQHWNQYIKPIYNLLQRIRSALVVFRLLGFKWAKALDARIVQIETDITAAFAGVLANLNMLANWINFIIDPFGVLSPNVWLGSIAQSVGAILGSVYGTMRDPGFTAPPGQYSTPAGYYTSTAMTARFRQRAQIGLLPDDAAVLTSLRNSAAALGYTE